MRCKNEKSSKVFYDNIHRLNVCDVEFYIFLRSNEARGLERDDNALFEECRTRFLRVRDVF